MESTYKDLPHDARKYHLRLDFASRRRRELMWRLAGGAPWARRSKKVQGTTVNDVKRRKLELIERL